MRRPHIAAVILIAILAGVSAALALQLYRVSSRDLSVTFVSDPPGATLVSADSKSVLGVAPVTVAYTRPDQWTACASYGGFRARWPDGRQMAVNRIELCPDGGDNQELRFSAPPRVRTPRRGDGSTTVPRQDHDEDMQRLLEYAREVAKEITPPTPAVDAPAIAQAPPPSTDTVAPEQPDAAPLAAPRRERSNPTHMAVQVIGRQSNETGYSFVVPGYVSTNSSAYANCYGSSSGTVNGTVWTNRIGNSTYGSYDGTYRGTTTANCSGASNSTTTFSPARQVSYSVNGASLSLRLPDGRVAVVNCASKADWWSLGQMQRSCRIPTTDRFEAEFNGDKAKLFWRVGVSGEKGQSETYTLIEIVEPAN